MSYPSGQGELWRLDRFERGAQPLAQGVFYQVHSVPERAGGQRPVSVQVRLPGGEPLVVGEPLILEMPDALALQCVVAAQESGMHRYRLRLMAELSFS